MFAVVKTVRRLAGVVVAGVLLLAIVPSMAGASTYSKASNEYLAAFNAMINSSNKLIKGINSSNPRVSADSWNATIRVQERFDSRVLSIKFPKAEKSAAAKVISTDAVLESEEGILSANTGTTSNYNTLFDLVTTDQANATAAQTVLAEKLGLSMDQ